VRASIPPLPVCSQRSQIVREVRVSIPPRTACTQRSQVVRGESEHSTATSLLPAKPDPLLPAKPDPPPTACSQRSQIVREVRVRIPTLTAYSQRSQIVRGESEHSITTSLLPAKPDPLQSAKPDPPLTACSQRSQIVREVRVSIPPLSAKPDCQR